LCVAIDIKAVYWKRGNNPQSYQIEVVAHEWSNRNKKIFINYWLNDYLLQMMCKYVSVAVYLSIWCTGTFMQKYLW